jgi:AcrR family transcriptional regulator
LEPMPRSPEPAVVHRPARLAPGRRERHRTEVRERLYRAALDLFAQRGYLETKVEDITDAADVGKGTFFNYFPTKEHVLGALGMERVAIVQRAFESVRSGDVPVVPVLNNLASELTSQDSPGLLRAILVAHASSAPVRVDLQKRMRLSRRALAGILAVAQRRGEIRSDISALALARLTQFALMGAKLAWSMDPQGSSRRTGEDLWAILYSGIKAKKSVKRGVPVRNSKGKQPANGAGSH